MNIERLYSLVSVLALSSCMLLTACKTGPYPALKHGTGLEETETLVLLDKELQKAVSVDAQRCSFSLGKRLQAEANIRNCLDTSLNIQVQTIFKDSSNMSAGDETAWRTIILQPYATETYSATALNELSDRYTIRVRLER